MNQGIQNSEAVQNTPVQGRGSTKCSFRELNFWRTL